MGTRKNTCEGIDEAASLHYSLQAHGAYLPNDRQKRLNRESPEPLAACNEAHVQGEYREEARLRPEDRNVRTHESRDVVPAHARKETAEGPLIKEDLQEEDRAHQRPCEENTRTEPAKRRGKI